MWSGDGGVRKSSRSKRLPDRYGVRRAIGVHVPNPEDAEQSDGDDFDRLAGEPDDLRLVDDSE